MCVIQLQLTKCGTAKLCHVAAKGCHVGRQKGRVSCARATGNLRAKDRARRSDVSVSRLWNPCCLMGFTVTANQWQVATWIGFCVWCHEFMRDAKACYLVGWSAWCGLWRWFNEYFLDMYSITIQKECPSVKQKLISVVSLTLTVTFCASFLRRPHNSP